MLSWLRLAGLPRNLGERLIHLLTNRACSLTGLRSATLISAGAHRHPRDLRRAEITELVLVAAECAQNMLSRTQADWPKYRAVRVFSRRCPAPLQCAGNWN